MSFPDYFNYTSFFCNYSYPIFAKYCLSDKYKARAMEIWFGSWIFRWCKMQSTTSGAFAESATLATTSAKYDKNEELKEYYLICYPRKVAFEVACIFSRHSLTSKVSNIDFNRNFSPSGPAFSTNYLYWWEVHRLFHFSLNA